MACCCSTALPTSASGSIGSGRLVDRWLRCPGCSPPPDVRDSRGRSGPMKRFGLSLIAVASLAVAALSPATAATTGRANKETPMTTTNSKADAVKASADEAIHPFRVSIPEVELTEMRKRIKATRWPEQETVTDASQGVPLA